jgi:ATP-dependent RNA helicase DeaD
VQKIGHYKGVKAFAIFGGEDASLQQSKLKHGVQVLVATPGRLIDFIYSRQIDLSFVETLILDEADEMLSMGFYDDLDFIVQCLVHKHQTLLFSATMPADIRQIAKKHMQDPIEVVLTAEQASPHTIEHQFLYCRHEQRDAELVRLIEQMKPVQCIVFCHSRFQVEKVCQFLKRSLDGVDFLHAGLGQDIRTIVTSKFRSGKIRILVATDVVARGLDFSKVSHVFIYQLSADPDIYVHRSGRTGRYDKTGVVISLVTPREMPLLHKILRLIKKEPIWIGDPPPAKKPEQKKPLQRRYPKKKRPENLS